MIEEELKLEIPEEFLEDNREERTSLFFIFFLPALIFIYATFGIIETSVLKDNNFLLNDAVASQEYKNFDKVNILSGNDIAQGLKDTVYTTKDCWLELRIDKQTLYQHWRDGSVDTYPVSTGDKHLDSKALETRPGLFAIFYRNAHHMSSQFDLASMYHYMAFNQGIGFHSINGTAYYQFLGKKPSSHGCIRLNHKDAEKLFKGSEAGTLVIAHNGQTARTVGFAPKDYENKNEFSPDEYKYHLAKNLSNILNGRYFLEDREFFVVDPKVIPPSGVYISYDQRVPKQIIPREYIIHRAISDQTFAVYHVNDITEIEQPDNYFEYALNNDENVTEDDKNSDGIDRDLIKKYFHNPIGILPIFPPSPRFVTRVTYTYVNASPTTPTSTNVNSTPGGNNTNSNNQNSDN